MDFSSSSSSPSSSEHATPEEQQQALVQGINAMVVQMLQGVRRHNALSYCPLLSYLLSKPARLVSISASLRTDASLTSWVRMSRYAWLSVWIECNVQVATATAAALIIPYLYVLSTGLSPILSLPRPLRRWHRICRVL